MEHPDVYPSDLPFGVQGGALELDGVDDAVMLDTGIVPTMVPEGDTFTLAFYVKHSAPTVNPSLIQCGSPGSHCPGCIGAAAGSTCQTSIGNCGTCGLNACLHSPNYAVSYDRTCTSEPPSLAPSLAPTTRDDSADYVTNTANDTCLLSGRGQDDNSSGVQPGGPSSYINSGQSNNPMGSSVFWNPLSTGAPPTVLHFEACATGSARYDWAPGTAWSHIGIVSTPTTVKFFADGVEQNSTSAGTCGGFKLGPHPMLGVFHLRSYGDGPGLQRTFDASGAWRAGGSFTRLKAAIDNLYFVAEALSASDMGSLYAFSAANTLLVTRSPTAAPTSAPTAPTASPTISPTAPTSSPTLDPHASCGSNFSCYANLNTPAGSGALTRHRLGTGPKQNEPHIDFGGEDSMAGQNLVAPATVSVRGYGGIVGAPTMNPSLIQCGSPGSHCPGCIGAAAGSTCQTNIGNCGTCGLNACLHSANYAASYDRTCTSQPRDDSADYVTNIWVLNQNGSIICDVAFDSDRAARAAGRQRQRQDPVLPCPVPLAGSVTTVQAYVFWKHSGLYSGPVLNVAHETYAAAREAMTSTTSGVGPGYRHVADATRSQHDPFIQLDLQSNSFVFSVLGEGGSQTAHRAGHRGNFGIRDGNETGVTRLEAGYYDYLGWIEGDLGIVNNPTLRRIDGLNNVTSIGGQLIIHDNAGLESFAGLQGLETVGGLFQLANSPNLRSCPGLGNLRRVFGMIDVRGLHADFRWDDLRGLECIGGLTSVPSEAPSSAPPSTSSAPSWMRNLPQCTQYSGYHHGSTHHGVASAWVRDQHGAIVHFVEFTDGVPPTFAFDLTTVPGPVSSLIPYQYGEQGLWIGVDPMVACGCTFDPAINGGAGGFVIIAGDDVDDVDDGDDGSATTAGDDDGDDGDTIIIICAVVAVFAACLCCCCFFFLCCNYRYVWFLRTEDGSSSYRAVSKSRKTPPTEGWKVCKKDDNCNDGRASQKESEPAPQVMLGDGKSDSEEDFAEVKVVTVQGAGDPMFNGTYVRTAELTQSEADNREGKIKWVKEGGTGEYMIMGGKEEKPEEPGSRTWAAFDNPIYDAPEMQIETLIRDGEASELYDEPEMAIVTPIYDGGASNPEGDGDGYLDLDAAVEEEEGFGEANEDSEEEAAGFG